MLEYINRLPTIPVAFAPSKRVIFTLDDYSPHLPPEIESALFQGYFLIYIGGGVTGDVQVNDTAYHKDSKAAYRKKEMQLMLYNLTENPNKIPQPSRDQIMQMFRNVWDEVYTKIICVDAYYKKTMMTLAFNGSEDHLASKKLMDLVGKMLAFSEELIKSQ